MIKEIFRYYFSKFRGYNIKFGGTIKNSTVSKKSVIGSKTSFTNSIINDYSYISDESRVRDCVIGKFVSIGRNVKIGLANHPIEHFSLSPFLYKSSFLGLKTLCDYNKFSDIEYKKTVIRNDVWIGDNVIIPGGVTVGDGVIIGAGAIVTKDLEDYGIYVGIPAKKIGTRAMKNRLIELGLVEWWERSEDEIREIVRAYNE